MGNLLIFYYLYIGGLSLFPNSGIIQPYAEFINSLLSIYGYITKQLKSIAISNWVNSARDCPVNGTDNHIVLMDLTKTGITGYIAEIALQEVGIITNRNLIPFDKRNPLVSSGLRLGSSFLTSRGFKSEEMTQIVKIIDSTIKAITPSGETTYHLENKVRDINIGLVKELALQFPIEMDFSDVA
jgi:glycine hydroxymethyltransferase